MRPKGVLLCVSSGYDSRVAHARKVLRTNVGGRATPAPNVGSQVSPGMSFREKERTMELVVLGCIVVGAVLSAPIVRFVRANFGW